MLNKRFSKFALSMMLISICSVPVIASAATGATGALTVNTTISSGLPATFAVTNNGSAAIDLSTVKLRYYFTTDSASANTYDIDYTPIAGGAAAITKTFVTMPTATATADTYLEIGFTSAAGQLAAGSTATLNGRLHKSDYSAMNTANDYSATGGTTVTGFVGTTLAYGVEGGVVVPNSTLGSTGTTFTVGKATATAIAMTLNTNTLKDITSVAASNYTVSGSTLTLTAAYLNTLPVGTTNLTVNFSAGTSAKYAIVVTAAPVATFTMTAGSVTGAVGANVVVPISLATLPSTGIAGTNFTLNYDATKLQIVSATAGALVTPATNFDKNLATAGKAQLFFCDESLASNIIKTSGVLANVTFKIIAGTGTTPITISDYVASDVNGTTVLPTVKAGTVTIGTVIPGPTVTPSSATVTGTALTTTITLNGDTLTGIKYNGVALVYNVDYTKTTNTAQRVLTSAFLAKLPVGNSIVTYTFSSGKTVNVTLTKTTVPVGPVVTPASATVTGTAALTTTITLNGDTLSGIKYNGVALVFNVDYTKTTNTAQRVLTAAFLAKLPVGNSIVTYTFTSGKTVNITLTKAGGPVVTPATATVTKSAPVALTTTITLNGDTLSGIKYNGTALVFNVDYTKTTNTAQRVLTAAFLGKLPLGTNVVTYTFVSGKTATVTLTVK